VAGGASSGEKMGPKSSCSRRRTDSISRAAPFRYSDGVDGPRVPVQMVERSERVEAALRFAAGASAASSLSAGLCYLCEQLAGMTGSPVASVYVLEPDHELVLRGNHGFTGRRSGKCA